MKAEEICFETLKLECRTRGMDPCDIPFFTKLLNDKDLQEKRLHHAEILEVVTYFLEEFLLSVKGIPIVASLCDAEGYLIKMLGDESIMNMINQMGIKEGVRFTEEDSGINSINLAVTHKRAIEIIGDQHYHQFLHASACYSVPIMDNDEDKVIGTISIMTSITHASPLLLSLLSTVNHSIERELKLLKQNHQLNILNQIILDTTRNGILIVDQNGKLIDFNPYAEQLTGMKKDHMIGKSISELDYYGSLLVDVLQKKQPCTDIEITFHRKDGEILIMLFDALPIFDEEQNFKGAFAQFRDITERKRTEQLLLNSEKLTAVGQMAASVAHEIRNPLTTIRGFIQFMESDFSDKSHFKLLLTELDRINFIVSEFLILSKPHVLNYQYKNLLKILDETISLFQAHANMNNILVEKVFEEEELIIKCDENQLKQVFMNVLKNSMEAMPFGGQLVVRTLKNEHHEAVIEIQDDGCGMESDQIVKLGNPFYTTKDNGTGLGYMVIKRIIDHHKGQVNIQSELNKGTSVEIRIPIPT
ncbi:ATP-binding protein [Bacillus sp. 03113]|uniref:ATP-binding protein n=1 Tax=Bacillus sp. 03113 TaxID=2578211 RepID=UPI001143898A|nr:ATP-binding protein [Bacillus sp. 03113]